MRTRLARVAAVLLSSVALSGGSAFAQMSDGIGWERAGIGPATPRTDADEPYREDAESGWSDQTLIRRPPLVLVPFVPDAAFHARAANHGTSVVAPFSAARYGFDTIRVYFGSKMLPLEQHRWREPSHTLELSIELSGAGRPTRWLRLQRDPGVGISDSQSDDDVLAISHSFDEDSGAFDEDDGAQLATPDPRLPILVVAYTSNVLGHTSAKVRIELILDFRRQPRVLALLRSEHLDGGGACSGLENAYGSYHSEAGCQWDARRGDFLCAETIKIPQAVWGARRGSRWFYLDSQTPAFLYLQAGAPRTLKDFAGLVARNPQWRVRSAFLPDLGTTTFVIAIPSAHADTSRLLFAAPSLTSDLHVRFFLATIRRGRVVQVDEVGQRVSLGSPNRGSTGLFTPDGAPPSYAATLLETGPEVRVARVVVSEGNARSVYLIGIEEHRSELSVDAFRVATTGATYEGCDAAVWPASAAGIELTGQPFRAHLDIEPSRNGIYFSEEPFSPVEMRSACPATATLRWTSGEGFALDHGVETVDCPPALPRSVEITEDGRVIAGGVEAIFEYESADPHALRGEEVRFYVQGRGEPAVVFLSDWLADRRVWTAQMDAVSSTHMTIAPLVRDLDSIDAITAATVRIIRHLQLKRVVVVGHGLGAAVALEVSRRAPDTIAGVVTLDLPRTVRIEPMLTHLAANDATRVRLSRARLSPDAAQPVVDDVTDMLGDVKYRMVTAAATAVSYATYSVSEALGDKAATAPIWAIDRGKDAALRSLPHRRVTDLPSPVLASDFPMMEDPEAFNLVLWRILKELAAQ